MPRQMRQQRLVAPRDAIAADVGAHETMAPIRPLPRGPGGQQVLTELASGIGENIGSEQLARGLGALDFTMPEPGTALRAAPDLAMGGLGLLGTLGMGADVGRAPRVGAAMAEPVTPIPQSPARQIGANGLPIREPQPFRQSFVGGSDDLNAAARMGAQPHTQTDLFPLTAPGPVRAWHGTMAQEFDTFDPFSHFGTQEAANTRLRHLGSGVLDPSTRQGLGQGRIIPVEIGGRRINVGDELPSQFTNPSDIADLLLRGRHITPEEYAYAMEPRQAGSRFEGRNADDVVKERLLELSRRHDIGAIGYRNAIEDAGSTSYIVPDPANVRRLNQRPDPHGEGVGARDVPAFSRRSRRR